MASKEETKLVKKCMRFLREAYPGFYFKTHGGPYQVSGLPDIIGVYKGKFIGIEIKCPGKEETLTDLQKKVIKRISSSGGVSFMATSPEEIQLQLEKEIKHGKSRNDQKNSKRKS